MDNNCTMQVITKKDLKVEDYAIDMSQETKGIRKYKFILDPFQKAAILTVGTIKICANHFLSTPIIILLKI